MYRGNLISINKRATRSLKSYITADSLFQINPVFDGKHYYERIEYTRVRTEHLNLKTLKVIKDTKAKRARVGEEDGYFTWHYSGRPKMYISKEDGLVYSKINNWESSLQATIILRVLCKFGYVEGFRRIQRHKATEIKWEDKNV